MVLTSFLYMAPRYTKSSFEIGYGRSPAMTALADIKMLNKMSEVTIRQHRNKLIRRSWCQTTDLFSLSVLSRVALIFIGPGHATVWSLSTSAPTTRWV